MKYEEARAVVDRISHPFMLFVLEKHPVFGVNADDDLYLAKLRISHKCFDSRTLEPILINRTTTLHLLHATEERLVDAVWGCVRRAADHEAGEYFQYKGVAIHFPHERAA